MTEAELQALILLKCSAPGVRLFRNAVGTAWHGQIVRRTREEMTILHPRSVTYGWCQGSSDLLGWRSRLITEHDVGETIAQLVGLEVKGPRTRIEPAQHLWHAALLRAGAASGIVRSLDEARDVLGLVSA